MEYSKAVHNVLSELYIVRSILISNEILMLENNSCSVYGTTVLSHNNFYWRVRLRLLRNLTIIKLSEAQIR